MPTIPALLKTPLDDEPPRHVNGDVTRSSIAGHVGARHAYEMTLRPWPWLLTRTTGCRIFQGLSVPDIVRQVCETDFNVVARLPEHEGIDWYLSHADGSHQLVLTDSSTSLELKSPRGLRPLADRGSQVQRATRR